ncbi:vascular endothelial growth factor B isoform 1-T1 [Pangshura tecta]
MEWAQSRWDGSPCKLPMASSSAAPAPLQGDFPSSLSCPLHTAGHGHVGRSSATAQSFPSFLQPSPVILPQLPLHPSNHPQSSILIHPSMSPPLNPSNHPQLPLHPSPPLHPSNHPQSSILIHPSMSPPLNPSNHPQSSIFTQLHPSPSLLHPPLHPSIHPVICPHPPLQPSIHPSPLIHSHPPTLPFILHPHPSPPLHTHRPLHLSLPTHPSTPPPVPFPTITTGAAHSILHPGWEPKYHPFPQPAPSCPPSPASCPSPLSCSALVPPFPLPVPPRSLLPLPAASPGAGLGRAISHSLEPAPLPLPGRPRPPGSLGAARSCRRAGPAGSDAPVAAPRQQGPLGPGGARSLDLGSCAPFGGLPGPRGPCPASRQPSARSHHASAPDCGRCRRERAAAGQAPWAPALGDPHTPARHHESPPGDPAPPAGYSAAAGRLRS